MKSQGGFIVITTYYTQTVTYIYCTHTNNVRLLDSIIPLKYSAHFFLTTSFCLNFFQFNYFPSHSCIAYLVFIHFFLTLKFFLIQVGSGQTCFYYLLAEKKYAKVVNFGQLLLNQPVVLAFQDCSYLTMHTILSYVHTSSQRN